MQMENIDDTEHSTDGNPGKIFDGSTKVAIIADKNTVIGFKLSGIHIVRVIEEPSHDEILNTLNDIVKNPEVRFVIITEPLVEVFGLEKFEKYRKTLPEHIIISVIPDRSGSRSKIGEGHLWQLMRRAVGARPIG
jgi:vacuolar-type H+-ATPase subunit F/Vma7